MSGWRDWTGDGPALPDPEPVTHWPTTVEELLALDTEHNVHMTMSLMRDMCRHIKALEAEERA